MSDPQKYTVGWICAITAEFVAAQAFLDEKHEAAEVAQNDNNTYALGRIGSHHVVIAPLPDAEYGKASAATVATNMSHSFPNVRIGLMVGVGGGAPSPKQDIRLGDVVVSRPDGVRGGVFQYDFGKTIQDETFHYTGFLNQPPTVLRTALAALRAKYEMEGHQLERDASEALKKIKMKKKYSRPPVGSDMLYKSEVVHPAGASGDCYELCGCDPDHLVARGERDEEEDDPVIHYGLIASGDKVIKDARIRDKLAAEKSVLCFEMEAAGLMNHFPCLVIRGICDYSDSHKNKAWQGFAAMMAAAYAKDLLRQIPHHHVEAERRIGEIIQEFETKLDAVRDITASTHKVMVEARQQQAEWHEDAESKAILNWLTPTDYWPQQSDFLRRRQEGSGQWLLDSAEYQDWAKTEKQTLFCPGIPGAGKTILTSIVVEDLYERFRDQKNVGIAFLYCNFGSQDDQRVVDLLASLLKQLAQGQSSLPGCVRLLHTTCAKKMRRRPLLAEISRGLRDVSALHSRVFIIIDALDECQLSDGSRAKLLSECFDLQAESGVNLFATSRFIADIMAKFSLGTTLEIRAHPEDVRRYIGSNMARLPSCVASNESLQEEIKEQILQAVDGMFLLAKLHLDSLQGELTPKAIRNALAKLHKGSDAYDHAYDSAMHRVESQVKGRETLAKKVLSWIICAKRLLSTTELQHALSVEFGEPAMDEENMPQVEDLVSFAAGLVTIDEESGVVRLVHYTTQEYFKRTWRRFFPDAEGDMADVCATYLAFDVFKEGPCMTNEAYEARLRSNPLYDYATQNWGHHARKAASASQAVMRFLGTDRQLEAHVQGLLFGVGKVAFYVRCRSGPVTMAALHLAAYFGLLEVATRLLLSTEGPDLRDAFQRTPLIWAAGSGHEAFVKLLLDTGEVDINWKSNGDETALLAATLWDHRAVVKLLLDTGKADVNAGGYNGIPLTSAAGKGFEAVARLILDTGEAEDVAPALLRAAENGHDGIVKMLLETGRVDVNFKDEDEWTALRFAAMNGHERVVKVVLDTGKADLQFHAEGDTKWFHTAIGLAVIHGYWKIVQLLVDTGKVDVNSAERDGSRLLPLAAYRCSEAVVRVLLGADNVDVNVISSAKNMGSGTALYYAAVFGENRIVEMLLSTGKADVNAAAYGAETPLSAAIRGRGWRTAQLLLDTGKVSDVSPAAALAEVYSAYIKEDGWGKSWLRHYMAFPDPRGSMAQLADLFDSLGRCDTADAVRRERLALEPLFFELEQSLESRDERLVIT